MATRTWMVVLLAALGACGKGDGTSKEGGTAGKTGAVDDAATRGFIQVLDAVGTVEPVRRLELLAAGAFETIAADLPCLGELQSLPPDRRAAALAGCGFDPRRADGSPDWFVLEKVGERAARRLAAAEGALRADLERAMGAVRVPLPLAAGTVELPAVPAEAAVPVRATAYVVVVADGALRVGAAPEGRLGARGAERVTPRGAPPPGDPVERSALIAAVGAASGRATAAGAASDPPIEPPPASDPAAPAAAAKAGPSAGGLYQMRSSARPDPASAREEAIEQARKSGILGAMANQPGEPFAHLSGGGPVAGVGGEVAPAGIALDGRIAPGDGPAAALLLAHRGRPATEVIDLAHELGAVLAGVAAPGAPVASALRVELAAMDGGGSPAAPLLHIALADTVATAERRTGPGATGAGAADRVEIPRPEAGHDPAAVAAAVKALAAPGATAVLRAEGTVTWGELIAVAGAVIPLGVETVVLTSPAREAAPQFGGLLGDRVGDVGGFGLGGEFGTIGHGSGTGSAGAWRNASPDAPTVKAGESQVSGELDKNIIRRYIRRQLPRVRFCYEKRLLERPTLAGTLTVTFTITETGAVEDTRARGLGDQEVETCVSAAIGGIQFPKPRGGTVSVSYPFVFKPSN